MWGTGTGAQNLARPLFAYELEGDIFLVTVLLAFSAIARLVASPITGFMTDRWGRRPLLIIGAGIRGATGILSFFASSYMEFFVLEFIGGVGIAMWNTSANILIADVTEPHVRGRVVAMRGMSMRAGQITGPLLGALIAAFFDIRTIFLVNGVAKFVTLFMALYLIKESRVEDETGAPRRQAPRLSITNLRPFLTRGFILVILATFAVSMMGQGVFAGLLPIYAQELANLNEASIGTLIGIGGLISVLVAFPSGMVSDGYGRKFALVPGLALLAVSAYLLSHGDNYTMLLTHGVRVRHRVGHEPGDGADLRDGYLAGAAAGDVPRRVVAVPGGGRIRGAAGRGRDGGVLELLGNVRRRGGVAGGERGAHHAVRAGDSVAGRAVSGVQYVLTAYNELTIDNYTVRIILLIHPGVGFPLPTSGGYSNGWDALQNSASHFM